MSEPINGDVLLARVKPVLKESRTQICLRPDLVERHEILSDELAKAQESAPAARMAGKGSTAEAKKIAKDIVALEAEIEGASAWFVHRALPKDEFRALCAKFPPRKDNQIDLVAGYDRDAVADLLIRECLIDPVFSDTGWAAFLTTCAPTEWSELRDNAFEANGGTSVPKSLLASQVLSPKGNASA